MANSPPLQLQWRKHTTIRRLSLMRGVRGEDIALSYLSHEQFE